MNDIFEFSTNAQDSWIFFLRSDVRAGPVGESSVRMLVSYKVNNIFQGIISCLVQIFFAWRIYIMSGQWIYFVVVGCLALLSGGQLLK